MYSTTEYRLLDVLNDEPDEIKDFVSLVFENNGFIAGGFATCVARLKHKLENLQAILDYLTFLGGDIDVYFENKEDLQRARAAIETKFQTKFLDSYTRFALNMCVQSKPRMARTYGKPMHFKFSLIQGMFKSPEETLDSFDITNAKVAITKDAMIMHNAWLALETKLTLDVSAWNCQYEFQRLKKWISKWRYRQFSQRTAINAYAYAEKLLTELRAMQDKLKTTMNAVNCLYLDEKISLSEDDIRSSLVHLANEINFLDKDIRTIRSVLTSNAYGRSISINDVDNVINLLYVKMNDTYNFNNPMKEAMLKIAQKHPVKDEFSELL